MNNLTGTFHWTWNCPPGPNDIDLEYFWGEKGTLTIQRDYLRRIIFSWPFCNSKDGWIEETKTFDLSQPTSEPYTFPTYIGFVYNLGKHLEKGADEYWGRKYKVTTVLHIISGRDEILDEEYPNLITGYFRRVDPYFNPELQPGCIPPDVSGETGITICD